MFYGVFISADSFVEVFSLLQRIWGLEKYYRQVISNLEIKPEDVYEIKSYRIRGARYTFRTHVSIKRKGEKRLKIINYSGLLG